MKQKPIIRPRLKLYSLLLLVSLTIALFFGYYYQHNFNPQNTLKNIEYKIALHDDEINKELNFLKDIYQSKSDSIFEIIDRYKNLYEEKGYCFLIFDNNELRFWSDNKASISVELLNSNAEIVNSGNGWFRKITIHDAKTTYAGFYLIKRNYNYQNDYLENTFQKSFALDKSIDLFLNQDYPFKINDSKGTFLFSLCFNENSALTNQEVNILFLLYLIIFILFITILYELHLALYLHTKKYLLFLFGFIGDILILRIAVFYFEIPRILSSSDLFSPFYYAYSDIIPSIADLFLNSLVLLIIGFFIFHHVKFNLKNQQKKSFHKYFVVFTLFLHIFIFFNGIDFIFNSLIIDSSISLDLNNIFSLSLMSFFNILIISMFILSYILISARLSYFAYQYSKNFTKYALFSFFAFLVFFAFGQYKSNFDCWQLIFVWIYILSLGLFYSRHEFVFNVGNVIVYILLFSIISTYSIHKYNSLKEKENRKLLAIQLSSEQRDPLAEYIFQRESDKIYNDEKISNYLNNYGLEYFEYNEFYNYFLVHYFSGYWKKYDCQITICRSDDILLMQPDDIDVNCFSYFEDRILNDGQPTESPGLFFVKYGPGENGYVAMFDFSDSFSEPGNLKLIIELYPKFVARDLGFPDLLLDKNIDDHADLSSYSYAKYQHGELYKRVGEYYYNFNLSHYKHANGQFVFFDQNKYNHLFYKIDDDKSIIISTKTKSFLDILAPFSYMFLFFILFFGFLFFLFIFPFSHKKTSLSFRTRLQVSISSVILFSFIVIGIFTLFYINNLNEKKNKDILSEKTHSVLVEMQHKFSETEYFDEDLAVKLSELLVKFSSVFFTDINLFDLDGQLISSSRPQIYDEKLISKTINPEAFKVLSIDNISLFIHNENIGKQEYLSAYIPFVNSMGDVIAYLNLPYFAKENDLNKEISTFLVAYINIYVILIAISLLIAILISNYISRPIKMIMTKIRQVKLGGQNEAIQWKRKDEIGQLVEEYNRMIDELALSAEMLAQSERESAWREMAKQIAHEIKNPLTPMKLSVQYLQRAWQNELPDYEKRLDKFTKIMIEQIDALSIIASEFSDFAKMPIRQKSKTDLVEILKSTISLFKTYDKINFIFEFDDQEFFTVFTDKEQLLRAFNNLIKNAIQAIGTSPDGNIEIMMKRQFQNIIVEITDNGDGISDEIAGKIFSPNFTTKSGGMGLGLAIVKNIIENSGGEISYKSANERGTTFRVTLPLG